MKTIIILALALTTITSVSAATENLKLSSTKPVFMKYSQIDFGKADGRFSIPERIKIDRGYASNSRDIVRLIFNDREYCEYRGVNYKTKYFKFKGCSDNSRAGDEVEVDGQVGLYIKKSYAFFSSLTVSTTLKIENDQDDTEDPIYIPGPQGEQGEQGVQGEQGEQGIQGEQGLQGIQGEKGDTGAQGLQGLTGAQGEKGDAGAQGIQGIQGEKGDTGAQGIQGEKGDAGAQGIQGIQGEKGDTGAQGIQGIQGEKGDTGAQGIQGIQGEKGDTGAQGIQGIQGEKGDTGAQGIQGIQGEKGDTGAQGIQGEKGETGEQGIQGIQGIQGETGAQGIAGRDAILDTGIEPGNIVKVEDNGKIDPSILPETSGSGVEIAYLKDIKETGTHGGGCVASDFTKRDLNTIEGETGFLNLEDNSFSLSAGTYSIEVDAPAMFVGFHLARLVSSDGKVYEGATGYANKDPSANSYSKVRVIVELENSTSFYVDHKCQTDRAVYGLGVGASLGSMEIYTIVKITKIK